MPEDNRILSRDVEATLIPQGEPMLLPKGESVSITHRLGGNFTVMTYNGMYRIKGADADALGEESAVESKNAAGDAAHEGPPEMEVLWEQLKTVFDPEIPVNIVDLGLVYHLGIEDRDPDLGGGHLVKMSMTLTAPGCGMGPAIAEDAKSRLENVPGVSEANVDIVWDPPWNQEMITEEGKMQLGLI